VSRRAPWPLLVWWLATLPTCAIVSKHLPGSTACKRIAESEVGWDEERDIGGALALSLASRSGGFVVAPAPAAALAPGGGDGGVDAAAGLASGADGGASARPDSSSADQLTLAVAEVGHLVARVSARPEVPWTFAVIDSKVPNAFSAPGGYVLVTTGLLAQVENEAQLAGVLAHEVAHVTLRHALHVYRTSKSAQCYADIGRANTIGTINVGSDNGSRARTGTIVSGDKLSKLAFEKAIDPVIDLIVSKGFSQKDELEADQLATDLLVVAGYDPREYRALLAKLPADTKSVYPNHPQPTERTKTVEARLSSTWRDFGWEQNPKVALDPRITGGVAPKTASR
jgi:Zn-dependent protease with chaperone function